MQEIRISGDVFTLSQSFNAFMRALHHGETCEIDEAMFVHWLESRKPVSMRRDVVLMDGREVCADFVTRSMEGDSRYHAFWSLSAGEASHERRYFAQSAACLI